MVTERKVLSVVGFDVGFPLSYRSEFEPEFHSVAFHNVVFTLYKMYQLPRNIFQICFMAYALFSFRYLRRYGRVCHITMPVLTLARFQRNQLSFKPLETNRLIFD